jgi:hypothetical protein
MIGPFPILQVVGGLIGGVGGFAVGYQLFSLRKPDLGWLARQLRSLGALAIMGIGMMLGQISGYFFAQVVSVMARTARRARTTPNSSFRQLLAPLADIGY